MNWIPYIVLAFGVLCLTLSMTEMYQDARREMERNRVVASELSVLKDMVGVSDATRHVLHSTIADLERGDPEQSLVIATFLKQMRMIAEFIFVDVLNSRAFTALVVSAIVVAGAYIVHAVRAK